MPRKELTRNSWRNNFSKWFSEILSRAEIIDYRYPVKGCGVWMPYGFKLRSNIIAALRKLLDETGHEEVLFPLLIPKSYMAKEAHHIKSFEDESYWVTHGGRNRLDVELALRPTSETAITPMAKLWLRSHATLPKKYYQIVSVFRYETKATRPLLRVREVTTFKEAHTFHATHEDALSQLNEAISIYREFFDKLCIAYIISERPSWDRFAGALKSIAFDTVFPDGRVLQIGTIHDLGQNFSRAFDATFETKEGEQEFFWQTSYGVSERVVASVIALHGDDHGLVLPPHLAPIQVIIIPIVYKEKKEDVHKYCLELKSRLKEAGIKAEIDFREKLTPGYKFYDWELRGVPLRAEIGPRDVEENSVTFVRRDTLEERTCKLDEAAKVANELFGEIARNLRERSWAFLKQHVHTVLSVEEAKNLLKEKRGVVEIPHCGGDECGRHVEELIGAKVLGFAVDSQNVSGSCCVCGNKAKTILRLAKTY